jgi:transcriptional regulator with XRE-family HTH domain
MSDEYQVGRLVRDVRVSRGRTQEELAVAAGVSRPTISRLERGLIDGLTVRSLRAISRGLRMSSIVSLGWRAPEVDRLKDRMHAALVEQVTSTLGGLGWEARPEYSFSQFGERGSVDILARHATTSATLVIEVKTRLWDIQNLLSTMDRKRRLVPGLAAHELGWPAGVTGLLLVLPEMSTHRHVVTRHCATFQACLPPGSARSASGWPTRAAISAGSCSCRFLVIFTSGKAPGASARQGPVRELQIRLNRVRNGRIRFG